MKKLLAIFNLLSFFGVLVLNGLSNGQVVEGKSIGSISESYPTLFTPAGITFSVWGIIYLGLLGFVIYQGRDLVSKRPLNMEFRQDIGPWFILSNLFNMGWLLAWLNESLGLSLVLIFGLLASLLMIYLRLDINLRPVRTPVKWFVFVPFSIYLGWVCVASIANTSAYLVSIKWSGLGLFPEIWTVLMIAIAGLLALWVGKKRKDFAFRAVVLWALAGIVIKIRELDYEGGIFLLIMLGLAITAIVISILLDMIGRKNSRTA